MFLLSDRFSAHPLSEEGLLNIQLKFFPPNFTTHVQAKDDSIYI
jgi:hypothetical protein